MSGVFDAIKALITKNGGELTDEEAPERFELAYEMVKHIDTKNRKFSSAYFGWVRFSSEASAIESIKEGLDENTQLLRYLLIKLTKAEEAAPFRFHEALAEQKVVTIDADSEAVVEEEVLENDEEVTQKEATEVSSEEAIEVTDKA